ncbi:MAG: class I SAM-dependent methyltransferase [Bacteroidota bacterium]
MNKTLHKDQDNTTFLADVEKVFSEQGKQFHAEKYLPKLDRVKKHLSKNARNALDVGIGYGSFMQFTADHLELEAQGMDPFPKSIAIAKQFVSFPISEGAIEDESWPVSSKFDFISCLDVTEHLERPEIFYKHVKDYLAPEGIVLMTTPLRLFPYEMRSWPIIGIPDKNTTHINVQAPKYWDNIARQNGFEIVESWRGEHLTHVKYLSGFLRRFSKALGINSKKAPFISAFQQAYNQILRLK